MNEQTIALIDQLRDKLVKVSDEHIIRMIQEARDEALSDAKNLLKERMLQAILEGATEEKQKNKKPATPGGTWFQPQPSL